MEHDFGALLSRRDLFPACARPPAYDAGAKELLIVEDVVGYASAREKNRIHSRNLPKLAVKHGAGPLIQLVSTGAKTPAASKNANVVM